MKLADFLYGLYSLRDEVGLVRYIIDELPGMISGDNCFVGHLVPVEQKHLNFALQHPFSRPDVLIDLLEQGVMAEHPVWQPSADPLRPEKVLTDMMTQAQWQSHPLYCEVLKADHVRDHLTIDFGSASGIYVMVGLLRSRPGFHEHDRKTLRLLLPHFVQAFSTAQLLDLHGVTHNKATETGCRAHHVDYFGRLVPSDSMIRKHWQKLFGLRSLAEEVRIKQWIRAIVTEFNSGYLTPTLAPLKVRAGDYLVEYKMDRASGGFGYKLLEKIQHRDEESHTLSRRETEVLQWVREGKTNQEISIILGLSLHTVKDHLKSIFRKLGVDNRTAAARAHHPH